MKFFPSCCEQTTVQPVHSPYTHYPRPLSIGPDVCCLRVRVRGPAASTAACCLMLRGCCCCCSCGGGGGGDGLSCMEANQKDRAPRRRTGVSEETLYRACATGGRRQPARSACRYRAVHSQASSRRESGRRVKRDASGDKTRQRPVGLFVSRSGRSYRSLSLEMFDGRRT